MISLGNDEITKYPFLAEAGQYLKDKGFTLEQFATDPDLQIIVDKAYERVECASWGKFSILRQMVQREAHHYH